MRSAPRPADRRAAAQERRARRAAVEDPEVVMEAAAAFLAVRPRSVAETRRRLKHLGYPVALVETVVARLVDMGYLDDEAFARAWVDSRDRARPRGESALRRELAVKGIEKPVADGVLDARREAAGEGEGQQALPDLHAAHGLLERRRASLLREPDERKRRQKAYALLARNGFDPDVCREAAWKFVIGPGANEGDDDLPEA